MNIRHLGDALDHWKGNMFRWLGPALRDLHVVPMFTDAEPATTWDEPTLLCFSQLLAVPAHRIMHADRRFRRATRTAYFEGLHSLSPACDIFFDPDNGIAPAGRANELHVTAAELAAFIPPASDRLLLVYQHSSRVKGYVRSKLEALSTVPELHGVKCIGYWAGSAAMVLMTQSESRIRDVRKIMASVPTATGRVVTHDAPPLPPRTSPSATR
jgi:hypothetical protein